MAILDAIEAGIKPTGCEYGRLPFSAGGSPEDKTVSKDQGAVSDGGAADQGEDLYRLDGPDHSARSGSLQRDPNLRRQTMDWHLEEAIAYYKKQGAPGDQTALVSLLREVQQENGGQIPMQALPEIADGLAVKESYLLAVVKRIPSLRLADRHCLELCAGPEARRQELEKNGLRWRFVATMEEGKTRVSLETVDANHPFYLLEGSNNIILITTERYHDYPMMIRGYGAGANVTAAGVFADILAVGM